MAQSNFNSLQRVTNYSTLDFGVDYKKGWNASAAHLSGLRNAASGLCAAASYNLHERDTPAACANLHTVLAIIREMTDERMELSQMVRMNMARVCAGLTWEILEDPNVSETDLAQLQQDWESLKFVTAARQTYLTERVIGVRSMEHYLKNPSDLWGYVNRDDNLSGRAIEFLWRQYWAYSDEKRALQVYQVLIEATSTAESNNSFSTVQLIVNTNDVRLGVNKLVIPPNAMRIDYDDSDMQWIFSEGACNSFRLLHAAMTRETVRSIAIAAIALKRHELDHHQFPPTLNDLIPGLLKTKPVDYMNGQMLHYRPETNGTFLLYSVGEDGVDDGGDPSVATNGSSLFWPNPQARDWVWPQPATSAEVEYFHEHPPK
jgi:hypothetical protein